MSLSRRWYSRALHAGSAMFDRCFLLSVVLVLSGLFVENDATSKYLDTKKQYMLEWSFTDVDITFTVTVNTTGWVGLGFSPNGGMAGSDIVTGWVTSDGIVTLQDRHATGKFLPDFDSTQNYVLLNGAENGGKTILQFKRPLDTHDAEDAVITKDTMRIVYAYGTQDPTNGNPTYHGANRGASSVYLLNEEPTHLIPDDAFTVDWTADQLTVPGQDTTYWCSLVKLPTLETKHHIIKHEAVIMPGNEDLVHHMLMYICHGDFDTSVSGYECFISANPPESLSRCQSLIAAWSAGGGASYYPEDAGYPIGGDNSPRYMLIQTHYNNGLKMKGRVDEPKLRVTLTKTLRQNDAGIMQVGIIEPMIIPPLQKTFQVSGYCSSSCLSSKLIPPEGLTVFSNLLHAHLLGRRVTLKHYRNGKELPIIDDDKSYDYNYQPTRLLDKRVTVLPGDTLQTTCSMDSSQRSSITYGGLATENEMCLSFISYFPRTELSECESFPLWTYQYANHPIHGLLNLTRSPDWNVVGAELEAVDWTNPTYAQAIEQEYNKLALTDCLVGTVNFTSIKLPWKPPTGTIAIPAPIG